MSDLAQRLVDVAKQAYPLQRWTPDPSQPNVRETIAELLEANSDKRARDVVVAVLRELADEHTSRDGNWLAIPPPTLRQLADSIEKGGQGG